jgi:hypothetical protein
MFKTVITLLRGSVAVAEEEFESRQALLILDQQMRDAATAVERAKRTLALAIAAISRRAGVSTPPTPASPIWKSAPPRLSMVAGKIWRAKRPRRSPRWRRTATPP